MTNHQTRQSSIGSLENQKRLKRLPSYKRNVIKMLDKNGWDIIAVHGSAIVRDPNKNQPYSYWFVIPFMGSNKKHEDELKNEKSVDYIP